MQLRNLMTSPLVSVQPGDSLLEAARRMHQHGIGSVVVEDRDGLAGILTERDVLRSVAEGADVAQARVADFMTREVVTAGANWDAVVAATVMTERRIRHLVVKEDRPLGMVSLRDVLSVFLPDQVHQQ